MLKFPYWSPRKMSVDGETTPDVFTFEDSKNGFRPSCLKFACAKCS